MKYMTAEKLFIQFYQMIGAKTNLEWDEGLDEAVKITKLAMKPLLAAIEKDDPTKS